MDTQQYESDSDLIRGLEFLDDGDPDSALPCFIVSMKNKNPLGALALGNVLEQKFLEIYEDEVYHIGSDERIDNMLNMMIAAYMFGSVFAEDAAEEIDVENRMGNIANCCYPEAQLRKICESIGDNLQNYISQSPELLLRFL